ncbi:CHAT domain-containing protein [Siphonobacter sp. SORGH_AS_0500]|uniref:CHAT domain-containing protein n=1 Tax=Siphonobacter sp. SORGH_AS_0500 TaxID=1864824 RepID=UPI003510624C
MLPRSEDDSRSFEEYRQEKERQEEQVATLRKQINVRVDDLVFTHPTLSLLQPLPPRTLADIQYLSATLGNIPLVEYVKHAGGWGAFVFGGQKVEYVALADDLLDQISESLSLLLQTENASKRTLFWCQEDWKERLVHLHEWVFKPLVPFLPSSGQVVVAPTNVLYLVPFQALCDEHGKYLSETYAFSFVPSLATLSVLLEQRKRVQSTPSTAYRLLNIAHSGEPGNYLTHIALEAQEVESQFEESVPLQEEKATLENVIEAANKCDYEVIHFNCHGKFFHDNPAHSGLQLAEQRMLTVNDIRINIRLKGRPLVTLSACQTGQTWPEQGDETTGTSWAFLAAGASSVLASQWNVPDRSTRALFKHFYQIRRQSQVSDAQALQQAIQQVRKQFTAFNNLPEFWAGFQVMGVPIPAGSQSF